MPLLERRVLSAAAADPLAATVTLRGSIGQTEEDSHRWVSYGSAQLSADLAEGMRSRVIYNAERLFMTSPLYARMVNLVTDFIVGPKLFLSSPNKEAGRILEEFWYDRQNALQDNIRDYVQELLNYGELALPVGVNEATGFVGLNFIPSNQIRQVLPQEGFPGKPDEIVLANDEHYKVIRWNPATRSFEGNVFFKRIHRHGASLRGYPLFMPLEDFILELENAYYNQLVRESRHRGYVWDVTLSGMTDEQINKKLDENNLVPPEMTGLLAHNEKVTWKLVDISAEQGDNSSNNQYMRNFILACGGVLDFIGSSPTSRRSETETDPVLMYLGSLRESIKRFLELIGEYVIYQAIRAGRLKDGTYTVHCRVPRFGARSLQRLSGAIDSMSKALALAEDRGWMKPADATLIFEKILEIAGLSGDE